MKLSALLLPAFAVATLFPRLLGFPPPFQQVQLTELLFPLLLLAHRRELASCLRDYRTFFLVAAVYLAANFLSAVWARSAGAGLEAGARAYLVAMIAITLAYLRRFGPEKLEGWWRGATVAVSILALLFYLLIAIGIADPLGWVAYFDDYPYFGSVARLRATAQTYGMWVMLLLPGLLLCWRDYLRGRTSILGAATVFVAMLPTLSKEILLAVTGMILLSGLSAWLRYGMSAALVTILLLGTHYVLLPPAAASASTDYIVGAERPLVGNWRFRETVYVPVHRAAREVGSRYPWAGVGPGEFARHSVAAAPATLPADFGAFDPHSTWLGAFAETGVAGVVGLLLLVAALFYFRPGTLGVAGVVLLLFLVSSIFKDVANYRNLWLVVGLYLHQSGRCSLTGHSPHQRLPPVRE